VREERGGGAAEEARGGVGKKDEAKVEAAVCCVAGFVDSQDIHFPRFLPETSYVFASAPNAIHRATRAASPTHPSDFDHATTSRLRP
jgi:hypothetical protein